MRLETTFRVQTSVSVHFMHAVLERFRQFRYFDRLDILKWVSYRELILITCMYLPLSICTYNYTMILSLIYEHANSKKYLKKRGKLFRSRSPSRRSRWRRELEEPSEPRQQQLEQEPAQRQVRPRRHPGGRRPQQPDGRHFPGAREVVTYILGGYPITETRFSTLCKSD